MADNKPALRLVEIDPADMEELPEATPPRLDGAAILDAVYAHTGRFICYPIDPARVAHVLWVGHCHLMDCWETTPRLAFLSAVPGSGKTRALEITADLVPKPVESVNTSTAALFRTISEEPGILPTLLFDEIDAIFGMRSQTSEEIRGLLNAGHGRDAMVRRCEKHDGDTTVAAFPVYCAVALAGIGWLPDTLLSRSIVVRMKRRLPEEQIEPYRARLHRPEGHAIRDRLAEWAGQARERIRSAWPELPAGIADRDADKWEPLLSVADVAGGAWPARARSAALVLVSSAKENSPSMVVRLLMDIRAVFGTAEKMFSRELVAALQDLPESCWRESKAGPLTEIGLARHLKDLAIEPKTIRIGRVLNRGYERAPLQDAWRRLCPDNDVAGVADVAGVQTHTHPPRGDER
jgi:hypothetical protein